MGGERDWALADRAKRELEHLDDNVGDRIIDKPDGIVCELYGLTDEEIEIVEGAVGQ